MSSVETGQMSAVETGQMSAAETGQMSAVETRQMLKSQTMGWAQNHQNGLKWVENGRQAWRTGPNESHGRSGAFRTGPVTKTLPKPSRNPQIGPFPRRRGTVLHPCTSVPQLRYAGPWDFKELTDPQGTSQNSVGSQRVSGHWDLGAASVERPRL